MPAMNDAKSIQQQYANADGLNIRMLLHHKYSTNRQPYNDWISEHYQIRPGKRFLRSPISPLHRWIFSRFPIRITALI